MAFAMPHEAVNSECVAFIIRPEILDGVRMGGGGGVGEREPGGERGCERVVWLGEESGLGVGLLCHGRGSGGGRTRRNADGDGHNAEGRKGGNRLIGI